MKWLSRKEEFVLLAVLRLRDQAYGVPVRDFVSQATSKYWSIGAIYDVLDRLTRKKLVSVTTGPPLPERGGRARRFYRVTRKGFEALEEVRAIHADLWGNLPEPITD
jgi:PadR family transcriptional regulator PadR